MTTDGKKALAEGKLAVVNNQVDTTSGTIRLKAVFDNKDHALWPGQSVSTRLLVKTLKDATVVPDDAIQHGTSGLYVYAVNADNKAELRQGQGQPVDRRALGDRGRPDAGATGDYRGPVQGLSPARWSHGGGEFGSGASQGQARNERRDFSTVYSLSHRHLADDGGDPVRRSGRLSAAAGRAAAAGRLPDHPDHRDPAGRQPGDHGVLGGAAAGTAVRARFPASPR